MKSFLYVLIFKRTKLKLVDPTGLEPITKEL